MLRTGPLLQFRDPSQMTVQDTPASWGAGMSAALSESFMGSLGPLAFRAMDRVGMRPGGILSGFLNEEQTAQLAQERGIKMLSPEEANSQFAIGDLKFEAPISETEARDLYETHKAMLRRLDIIQRSQIGGFEKFVAGLGGAALDPINLAAAYFPAVLIGWSARSATVGGRAAFGAAEGAIGGVPVTAGIYGLSQGEQRPYSLADAFLDVTFGTLLGAGLHVGIGAYKDWRKGLKPLPPIEATLEAATPMERVQLLRGAVADVLEGRPVGVGPLVQLAAREHAIQEFFKLRKAGERLTAEDTAALAQLLGVEEKLVPQIEALSQRIFELEQERASIAERRGEIGRELAPDEATADRLALIDTELATPNLRANRRDALRAERAMLVEGADNMEGSLASLRALREARGLEIAERRAGLRLERTEKTRRQTAAELKRAQAEFRRFSGRSASRASTIQAMAERILRRAAADMKAAVDQPTLAAMAQRVLKAKDPAAQIKAELEALAQTASVRDAERLSSVSGLTPEELAQANRINPALVDKLRELVHRIEELRDPASLSDSAVRSDVRATEEGQALIADITELLDKIAPGRAERGREFGTAEDTPDLRLDDRDVPPELRGKVGIGGKTLDRGAAGVVIKIAANIKGDDAKSWYQHIARHEVIHALRRLGLFTANEWDVLVKAASRNKWVQKIDSPAIRGADRSPQRVRDEEAIAEAYAIWATGRLPESDLTAAQRSTIERVFGRVTQFVKSVANYIAGRKVSTKEWERIFTAIERGEIGARDASRVVERTVYTPGTWNMFPRQEKVFPDAAALVGDQAAALRAELDALVAEIRAAIAQNVTAAPEGTAAPLNALGEDDRLPVDQADSTAERQAVQAEVARRQTRDYHDPQDEAVSAEIDETIETTPSFRKREPDEPIGTTTQAAEELKALDAETGLEIAELKRLGLLTEGEENALAEASEAVSVAQATAKVRDMAAMCLASMPESAA